MKKEFFEELTPDRSNLIVHIEYINSKRHHDSLHYQLLERSLAHKSQGFHLSLILCSDNNAFDFLMQRRQTLFPGVPIAFCGVNDYKPEMLQGHADITGVAHDLNNLLSPILGYGEMLLEDTPEADPRREFLKEIVSAGSRARDMVGQLLAFSRKQTLEFKPVDFNDLLRRFEKLLRRTIREDVTIKFNLAPGLPLIKGDVGQLEQVVMNLAVNAQDAMPHGGNLAMSIVEIEPDDTDAEVFEGEIAGPHVMPDSEGHGYGYDRFHPAASV